MQTSMFNMKTKCKKLVKRTKKNFVGKTDIKQPG